MTSQEEVALAVWQELHGYACKEPLRTKGGALDPNAWCMEAAAAILADQPLPWLYSDSPGVDDDFANRVLSAVELQPLLTEVR